MKDYLKDELTQVPPSLFNKDGTMISNGKSELGKILKKKVSCDTFSNIEVCVVDIDTYGSRWRAFVAYSK